MALDLISAAAAAVNPVTLAAAAAAARAGADTAIVKQADAEAEQILHNAALPNSFAAAEKAGATLTAAAAAADAAALAHAECAASGAPAGLTDPAPALAAITAKKVAAAGARTAAAAREAEAVLLDQAPDAAAALRVAKQAELDRAAALDQEVADIEAAPAHAQLVVAQAGLANQQALLVPLAAGPLRDAQLKAVAQAGEQVAAATLALNSAEVAAALVKANAALIAAQALAAPFNIVVPCAAKAADARVQAAQQARDALAPLSAKMNDFVKLKKACMDGARAQDAADVAKNAVVVARIAQLSAQGHGPQRHSNPDHATLKKRVIYGIDPESGDQTDGARLHVAGDCASKFNTPADYVKAEAALRAQLKQLVCPGGVPAAAPPTVLLEPPLTSVFAVPDQHCTGFTSNVAPPNVVTTLGVVKTIPHLPPPPPPPNHPPVPAFPPLVHPGGAPISKAHAKLYDEVVLASVQAGGKPQLAANGLHALLVVNDGIAAKKKTAQIIAAMPAVVAVSAPLAETRFDPVTMNLVVNDPVSTNASHFAGGKFTVIYKLVVPGNPCGEWTLLTMYPNPP